MFLTSGEARAVTGLLSTYEQTAFDALLARAGNYRISEFSSSLKPMPVVTAEFLRWLEARPDAQTRVLRTLVDEHPAHPASDLLKAAVRRVSTTAAEGVAAGGAGRSVSALNEQLASNRAEAGELINRIKRGNFRDDYIAGIHTEIADIARSYNWTPPAKVVETVLPVWHELAPSLQKDRHPNAESALFNLAAQVQGLLSYASLYLDETRHARAFAQNSLDLAELANSDYMSAWASGTLSMLYRFEDLNREALLVAERGLLTTSATGQIRSRLYSAAAESAAKLGRSEATMEYLAKGNDEAEEADSAGSLDLPGIFGFPEGKVKLYAGTALVELNKDAATARQSETQSQLAVNIFSDPKSEERSHPDLLIAQGHLAHARMQLQDLDGAIAALRPMLDSPIDVRTSWHRKLMRGVLASANSEPFSTSKLSAEIVDIIEEFQSSGPENT
ncbi:hypothetical protein Q9S36_15090 [Microbacterium sp. ARD31]|uniref:hypothetical protein n=1 Tax=Microbacterium sp. ARD31 TaxID=2962576 RepID=UPI0028825DE6|nr:hypothetical protein [Microbacterium sp. ARD31]MDT0181504.1 hypothetical protein [Microbacterium sp. ARD31]